MPKQNLFDQKWSSDMEISIVRRFRSSLLCAPCFCVWSVIKAWGRKAARSPSEVLLINFVLALINLFLLVMHLSTRMPATETYFSSPLTNKEKTEMIDILRVFTTALDRQHILYFMASGTLIGSYRHHGPIPWDDDTDLYILDKDRARVEKLVSQLGPHYRMSAGDTLAPVVKLFMVNGTRKFIHHSFTWPYVDMFFLSGNKTHFLNTDIRDYPVPKNTIFPLVRRPFLDMWLPAPCNVPYVLGDFNVEECFNRRFSHLMEFPMATWRQRFVPCERLYHLYPFAFRHRLSHNSENVQVMKETLKIDSWTLRTVSIRYPKVCDGREKIFNE